MLDCNKLWDSLEEHYQKFGDYPDKITLSEESFKELEASLMGMVTVHSPNLDTRDGGQAEFKGIPIFVV